MGQKAIYMQFFEKDTLGKPKIKLRARDTAQANAFLISFYQSKLKAGYYGFSIDSIYSLPNQWNIVYYPGEKITSFEYKQGNLTSEIYFTLCKLYGKERPEVFATKSSSYLANIGYPFTVIHFDSVFESDRQISMRVNFSQHSQVFLSKIINESEEVKIPLTYLYSILDMKPYDVFSLEKINNIPERIKNLPFFELKEKPNFIIEDSFCAMRIQLREIKKNRLNGIVGILPNSETSGELQFTGDVQLSLQNLFTRGIGFNLNWQKLQPFSQSLYLQFDYPYLFRSPLHVNTNFKLLKQDTSFISIDWKLGIGFVKTIRSAFEVSIQSTTSNLIAIDTSFVNTGILPAKLDFQNILGGLTYGYKKLDQIGFPKKGINLETQILVGYKTIRKNEAVIKRLDAEGKSLGYLYNGLTSPTFNAQAIFRLELYNKIKRYFGLKSSLHSKLLFSQNILKNENFRIGGNKNLRGFDEENIYTPYYFLLSEEIRWFVSNRSYMYSFVDVAMVQDNRTPKFKQDFPIGMGIGIALNTKGGIFGVSYAIGKQLDNSFDFKSSKIHFGYINEF
jgi:hypothetical protein